MRYLRIAVFSFVARVEPRRTGRPQATRSDAVDLRRGN